MKYLTYLFVFYATILTGQDQRNDHYITNQAPLVAQPFTALPLGVIQPGGWLKRMLEIQRDGLTGNMDSIYHKVCGPSNGWLGGVGDGWERGPYWLDGLVPLAYILDDKELQEKAQKWIEWSIRNQREDGYFGPQPLEEGYEKIPGTQQGNREDWWPKMVMLKVLQQYYMATMDDRVINLMTKYFQYQAHHLKAQPLDHWTFWGARRGADNLAVVYWLYNITGEKFLIELGDLIHKQTFPWHEVYTDGRILSTNPYPHLHCVNVAQGIKAPLIYYQKNKDPDYLKSVKIGLKALRDVHGFVNGMYGGDERLHGNDPTQGSELCSAIEMMFSFESILPITGDVFYADYLEKIAFNVLPAQHDDNFLRKQYFQQVNQVQITDARRNFFNDDYARLVYGVLTGYPCCTTNMHQGWPKFIQNLWYATADNGLAALLYGASEVRAKAGKQGEEVHFIEETNYPFDETIIFTYSTKQTVAFPFHLRIPLWCNQYTLKVNGQMWTTPLNNDNLVVIERSWKKGDQVKLTLNMDIRTSAWSETSIGIEKGPLVFALLIEEEWKEVRSEHWNHSYYEVLPRSDWNYGLPQNTFREKKFEIRKKEEISAMPWNLNNAPITLYTKGCQLEEWKLYNHSAGKIPVRNYKKEEECQEEITLVPYGCTALRISQFPQVRVIK